MRDMDRLLEKICEELDKIAEKGLNTGNLETAYKLIDMYKDLKNTEYWEVKEAYYMEDMGILGGYSEARRRDSRGRYSRADGRMSPDYDMDSSYRGTRGKHYVRGHYSRANGPDAYDDYMNQKQSYRSGGKDEECKRRMLSALEEHMDMLTEELGDLAKDADCREERETMKRYIEKLRNMM